MKRTLMTLVPALLLGFGSAAFAADAAAKPDCTTQQKAVDDATAAAKTSCSDKKGKDKTACEKPLKDKAKDDSKAAKDKVTDAKKALACCKNPKKKGCPG
jgi:type IV secretory pathway VirB6-like protein